MQRNVGGIEEEHDDSADAVPAVGVRNEDDGDGDDVVNLHLEEVLPLVFEHYADCALHVPRSVE